MNPLYAADHREVRVRNRREIQRNELRYEKPADNREAERPPRFATCAEPLTATKDPTASISSRQTTARRTAPPARVLGALARAFISLPAGIARMNVWRFTVLTFAGAYLWSLALAWAGYELGANWEDILPYFRPVSIPIVLAVLAGGAFWFYRRYRELRQQSV